MIVRIFILALLLLSELISNAATVNTSYGVIPSLHDLKLAQNTNTAGYSSILTDYTSYNGHRISFGNSSATPLIMKDSYVHHTSKKNIFIDSYNKSPTPTNTYMKASLFNSPASHSLRDFGICSEENQFLSDNSPDATPILFPTTIYRLGTGLIILFVLTYKKRVYT